MIPSGLMAAIMEWICRAMGILIATVLVAPDRSLHPQILEVKKEYQNIFTLPGDVMVGKIKVYNDNFFKNLDDVVYGLGIGSRWKSYSKRER